MVKLETNETFRVVGWQEFEDLTRKMGEEILKEHEREAFHYIVAIMRAGGVVARILSDVLGGVEIIAIGISSYTGINKKKEVRFYQELGVPVEHKKLLLVDEICDTGKTFLAALEKLGEGRPEMLSTASLFLKSHSQYKPDYVAETDDRWVVFPYEVVETEKNLGEE